MNNIILQTPDMWYSYCNDRAEGPPFSRRFLEEKFMNETR